jgi:hypothetical protein
MTATQRSLTSEGEIMATKKGGKKSAKKRNGKKAGKKKPKPGGFGTAYKSAK